MKSKNGTDYLTLATPLLLSRFHNQTSVDGFGNDDSVTVALHRRIVQRTRASNFLVITDLPTPTANPSLKNAQEVLNLPHSL